MAATPQEERDSEHPGHPNRPMEEEEPPAGVWNEQKYMFNRHRNITESVTQPHNASKYYLKCYVYVSDYPISPFWTKVTRLALNLMKEWILVKNDVPWHI